MPPPLPHHYQQQQLPPQHYGAAGYYAPADAPPPLQMHPYVPHPDMYHMAHAHQYSTQPPPLPHHYPQQPPPSSSAATYYPSAASRHGNSHRPQQPTNTRPKHSKQQHQQRGRADGQPPSSSVSSANGPAAASVDSNQVLYCEPCDKEITGLANFNAHCATHESCRHPGCTFSATKKVVMAHFHGAHGQFSGSGYKMIEVEGGQKFRVLLGTSPEEVEKWRAERRNRFPTPANVAKKEAQQEELRSAGGVVAPQQQQRGKKRVRQGADADGEAGKEGAAGEGGGDEPPRKAATGPRKKPCSFFARGQCNAGDTCSFSHDFEPRPCAFFVRSGRCTRGARCTFMHDRAARESKLASDREAHGRNQAKGGACEGAEGGEGTEGSVGSAAAADGCHETGARGDGGGDSRRAEKKRERTDDELRAAALRKKGALFLPKPLAGGTRGTLLKKLLQPEVDEEENIVLQCLRVIVDSQLF